MNLRSQLKQYWRNKGEKNLIKLQTGDPGAVPGLEFLLGVREAVSFGTWHLHRQFMSSMNLAGRIQKICCTYS